MMEPSASRSSQGRRVALVPGTPLLVNIGTTRPAITAMMNSTTSIASCSAKRGDTSITPFSAACVASVITPSSTSSATKK